MTKGAGSKDAALAMAYKLLDAAQDRWRMLNGAEEAWYHPATTTAARLPAPRASAACPPATPNQSASLRYPPV